MGIFILFIYFVFSSAERRWHFQTTEKIEKMKANANRSLRNGIVNINVFQNQRYRLKERLIFAAIF